MPIETCSIPISFPASVIRFGSIHPQGWVPIETLPRCQTTCAITPSCSIHPQGWVPIETAWTSMGRLPRSRWVAFTPKGGCPLKQMCCKKQLGITLRQNVAFTPKGGCPLKLVRLPVPRGRELSSSIHPQGWVPIETVLGRRHAESELIQRSIHPQGWVPIETRFRWQHDSQHPTNQVAFTPKGGCPLKPARYAPTLHTLQHRVAFTPKGGCPLKLPRPTVNVVVVSTE